MSAKLAPAFILLCKILTLRKIFEFHSEKKISWNKSCLKLKHGNKNLYTNFKTRYLLSCGKILQISFITEFLCTCWRDLRSLFSKIFKFLMILMERGQDVQKHSTSCQTPRLPPSSCNEVNIRLPKNTEWVLELTRRHHFNVLEDFLTKNCCCNFLSDFLITRLLEETS